MKKYFLLDLCAAVIATGIVYFFEHSLNISLIIGAVVWGINITISTNLDP